MNKKILISIVSVFLALTIVLTSCYVCLYVLGLEKLANVSPDEGKGYAPAISPILPLGATTDDGFEIAPTGEKEYSTYGSVELDLLDGDIVGYHSAGYSFSFDVSAGSTIVDSVIYNGKSIVSKYYESGDMYPDLILLGNNTVSTIRDERGVVTSLIVNDGYYSADRDSSGRVISTYFCGEAEVLYEYDENGRVVKESRGGKTTEYKYSATDGRLESEKPLGHVDISSDKIIYRDGDVTYEYIFGYEYCGERYLTSIVRNGIETALYSYVNGSVVSASFSDGTTVSYILDPDLDQVGMIVDDVAYYFVYDALGNIYCILDENGAAASFYTLSAYGMTTVTSVISDKNTVLNGRTIFDAESGAIITPGGVMLTKCDTAAYLSGSAERPSANDSILVGDSSAYGKRGALDFEEVIRAKVIEEVMFYLEDQGYATASNVSIVDESENLVGVADIYILDSMCAGMSIKNVFAGNRIYKVISVFDDKGAAENEIAEFVLEENKYSVEYFETYTPVLGDIIFEGQFIYFGYLVSYSAEDNGIITYKVTENKTGNYNNYNNIFDYDSCSYAVYSEDTFELSDWDYTKLIPGLNQEQYDVVESYISDALQICSDTTFDEAGYFDQSYYDSYVNSAMGDTLDAFVDLDPSAMVVLSSDGNVTVKAIPLFEQTAVRKQICRAVGKAVVATVVAGIISVVVPGSGVVVFAVLKGAVIAGLKASLGSLIVSVGVDLAKEHLLGQELNETIEERLLRYATTALNAYSAGVIGGAIAGNLRYRKFYKATGDTLSSSVSASERMQMKLDALDSKYSGGILDDSMSARYEYESLRMTIQSTDYSSNAIAKNIIISPRGRCAWLKKAMTSFTKVVPWQKLTGKEG